MANQRELARLRTQQPTPPRPAAAPLLKISSEEGNGSWALVDLNHGHSEQVFFSFLSYFGRWK